MSRFRQAMSSSIVKKMITAVTGLAITGFAVTHLLGNLTLYSPDGDLFNAYTQTMMGFGWLLYVAEAGLLAFFLVHIVNGIRLKKGNLEARSERYRVAYRSKGGPSKSDTASRNMAISGIILLVFLVVHVLQFRLGPSISEGYVTQVNGEEARDMHRLVVEMFANPWIVLFYVGSMVVLGAHLKHGVWSAFQSMGLINSRISPLIQIVGLILALILAAGFLGMPIWVHFYFGGNV